MPLVEEIEEMSGVGGVFPIATGLHGDLVFRAGYLSRIHRGHMGMGYTDPGAGTSFRPLSQQMLC